MAISRRDVLLGSAGAAGAAAFSFPVPAIAQSEPVKVGCLAAMTGPSSAPTIGFNRGVMFAADAINAAGGIKGRKLEIVMRDTQGDPTKAVNATQEMISRAKVHAIWGPLNSGEALATTPIMARAKMPDIHPCVVETLIDTTKFPNAFRMAPSNSQWDDAVRNYCLNILKVKKIAVIGDTTGYGTAAVNASVAGLKKDGAEVIYQANIDATQPDMMPDMLRARNAGAEAITCGARRPAWRRACSTPAPPWAGTCRSSATPPCPRVTSRTSSRRRRTGRRSTPSATAAAASMPP